MSTLLDVKGLTVEFPTSGGIVRAVEDFDLSLNAGETLAMVGESGSGKSTAALARPAADPAKRPDVSHRAEILFEGGICAAWPRANCGKIRGSRVGMIFQDPMMALNPVFRSAGRSRSRSGCTRSCRESRGARARD